MLQRRGFSISSFESAASAHQERDPQVPAEKGGRLHGLEGGGRGRGAGGGRRRLQRQPTDSGGGGGGQGLQVGQEEEEEEEAALGGEMSHG